MNKICATCKKEKDFSEFYINVTKKSGYQDSCKKCKSEYNRQHYKNNKETYRLSAKKARKKYKEKIKELIYVLKDNPCVDCGFKYPGPVMEFDHLDGRLKKNTISRMIAETRSTKEILEEIDKCERGLC
ncbi:MAG: hypothetical protein KGO96_07795 [Elusimicrobia bacterium]|nr:hypothetical protein [Elusimicrobiota bacterium]